MGRTSPITLNPSFALDIQNMDAISSLAQQRLLLEIEYNTEREAYRRQTESVGLMRKVKRGDAWYPIRGGRSYYNSLNQLVVEIFRLSDNDIEHNFEYGRPICFFRVSEDKKQGGNISYFKTTCSVNYTDGDRMVVIVPDSNMVSEVQNGDHLGVQLFFDETSYRLMFDALDRTMKAKGNRLAYLRDLFSETYLKDIKERHSIERMDVMEGTVDVLCSGIGTLTNPTNIANTVSEKASGVILAHNHPEGAIEPSTSDLEVTRKVKAAGQIVGVPLLDHIIFNRKGYYSFLENGML